MYFDKLIDFFEIKNELGKQNLRQSNFLKFNNK